MSIVDGSRAPGSLVPRGWSRARFALVVFAAFTVPALISGAQQYYTMRDEGDPLTWSRALAGQALFWYAWAALSPLVVWMSRRIERATPGIPSRLALLGAAGIAASFAHSATYFVVRVLVIMPPGAATPSFLAYARGWLVINLVLYIAIVSGAFAIENYQRYRDRELAASELAVQLSQAQLRALRMQLHPHFLFNALNTVAMLVRRGDDAGAVKMLALLSDLLRHVLDEDVAHEVTLRDELAFVDRYLAIERARFSDRLRVRVDVDDALLDAYVPNLILQPLVENAIKHGVARRTAAGVLAIGATRTDGALTITVRDDGPGLGAQPPAPGGIGLRNARERLEQLYGTRARLSLTDAPDGGAIATLTLPLHTTPVGDGAGGVNVAPRSVGASAT